MSILISRRIFVSKTGTATLSAAAVALLAGCQSMAGTGSAKKTAASGDTGQDAAILNTALGLEHEAIGAYQLGAESGLLSAGVLKTAVLFQGHHKQHRDALAGAVVKLGGTPVGSDTLAAYAKLLEADKLASEMDVVRLAAKLEKAATNAYLGVIPAFADPGIAQVAARLAADETMHWTVLSSALGEPLPEMALTFGA